MLFCQEYCLNVVTMLCCDLVIEICLKARKTKLQVWKSINNFKERRK
jgi:hypothetical protein